MLDKLIETNVDIQQSNRIRRLFLSTSTIIISGVIFALILSLFSQNLVLGQESIDLSSLISPTLLPAEKPQVPSAPQQEKSKLPEMNAKNVPPTRKSNIRRIEETPAKIPTAISSIPSINKQRPTGIYQIGLVDTDSTQTNTSSNSKPAKTGHLGDGFNPSDSDANTEKTKPLIKKELPKPPPSPEPKEKQKEKPIITGGVINGKAINLVKPVYPATARSIQLRGQVTIQVLIDENGKVESAHPVKGHPFFLNNAVSAARQSTFSSTTLSGQKVKIRGLIVYNFN